MDNLTYERKVLIRSEQVDMSRKLRISELFKLLEEASIAHTEELGCTREFTLDRGLLWVITRQAVQIEELPAYDEEIIVRSWQGDMQHVFFPRFYEIERGGHVIIHGQAMWMLIDEETRDMVMPEDYDISIPGRPGSDEMMLPSVRIPAGVDPFLTEQLVTRYSQIDINGHMNNTRYFDIVDDAMWDGEDIPVPRSILANYLSEMTVGEKFELRAYRQDDSVWFEGANDRRKFRIRAEY